MSRFKVVIPTLDRAKKLKRCVESLKNQTFKDFEIQTVEDADRIKAPRIWNNVLRQETDLSLIYICDDVELAPDCLEKAMEEVNKFESSDFLIGFKQLQNWYGTELEKTCPAAMGIIGSKFADRFPDRAVFCPDYDNMGVDMELYDYAVSVGVFVHAQKAKLVHYHPGFYEGEMDRTHKLTREHSDRDRETRKKRKDMGWVWGKSFERVRHG